MDLDPKDYDYDNLKKEGTGGPGEPDYKVLVYPFDKYEIKITLTPTNEFVGITEVKINKDFLSHKEKMTSRGVHDVDEFYRE